MLYLSGKSHRIKSYEAILVRSLIYQNSAQYSQLARKPIATNTSFGPTWRAQSSRSLQIEPLAAEMWKNGSDQRIKSTPMPVTGKA